MIGYLEGKVIWADQSNLIISVNGLGYEVNFSNEFSSSDFGNELKIFITHKKSEYGESLFGFSTLQEKIIFESLDSIKGVGSKVIFTIMSQINIKSFSDLQDLKLDDLVKLPGVGKSTAQKFLLGVSNKLKKEINLEEIEGTTKENIEDRYKGEIELLVEWGIKKTQLLSYLKENNHLLADKDSSLIIQTVLKNLGKS